MATAGPHALPRRPALVLRSALASEDARWAAAVTLLAFAIRLAFVLSYGRTKLGFSDSLFYDGVARSLVDGGGFALGGHVTAHWPPAYPFLLAGIYAVFGAHTINALIANAVIGSATVLCMYLVARRAFGLRPAIAAAVGLAILPGQLLLADVVLSETLYVFELVLFILLTTTVGRRWPALIGLGVLAGLAALTRGEGVVFPVVLFVVGATRGRWREALRHAAVVAGVMLLCIAPWAIRNSIVMHAFVPLGTNASATLWTGHNPDAKGGPTLIFPKVHLPKRHTAAEFEIAESKQLRKEAIDWALHHPLRELELIPLKLKSWAAGDARFIPTWINRAQQFPLPDPMWSVMGTLGDLSSYAILLGAILAFVLFRRELWRVPALRASLTFLALALVLYGFVYYGQFRYRMPLEPLMVLVTAAGITLAWRRWGPISTSPSDTLARHG